MGSISFKYFEPALSKQKEGDISRKKRQKKSRSFGPGLEKIGDDILFRLV